MAYCKNCGLELDDSAKFCPSCGQQVEEVEQPKEEKSAQEETSTQEESVNETVEPEVTKKSDADSKGSTFVDKVKKLNDTEDYTADYDKEDIEKNKVMAILSYISILVLVPIFAAKESKFARFHANQGLVLFIIEAIWWVIEGILSFIPGAFGVIIRLIIGLVNIAFLALAIIGIINAVNGKAKRLPVIGKFTILK